MNAYQTAASFLSAHAPLNTLVGGRVFADVATAGTALPLVVYSVPDQEVQNSLDNSASIRVARISVQAWGNTRGEVEAILDEVENAIRAQGIPIDTRNGFVDEEIGLEGGAVGFDVWLD